MRNFGWDAKTLTALFVTCIGILDIYFQSILKDIVHLNDVIQNRPLTFIRKKNYTELKVKNTILLFQTGVVWVFVCYF